MRRKARTGWSKKAIFSLVLLVIQVVSVAPALSIGHDLVSQKAYFAKENSDKVVYSEKLEVPAARKLSPFWLTLYNGFGKRPGFNQVKVSVGPAGDASEFETIADEHTFLKTHSKTIDLTGYFSRPLNLKIEGSAVKGDYFAWRLTTGPQVLTLFKASEITPGAKFAIHGFGFGRDPKVVSVSVQESACEIVSIKNEVIVAIAPSNLGGDRVTLYVKVGEKSSNYLSIKTEYKPPHIISISPKGGNIGSSITIKGANFSSVGSENVVRFGPHIAEVVKAVDSQTLICRIPDFGINNDTLPLTVTTNGVRSDNYVDFWCGTNFF